MDLWVETRVLVKHFVFLQRKYDFINVPILEQQDIFNMCFRRKKMNKKNVNVF